MHLLVRITPAGALLCCAVFAHAQVLGVGFDGAVYRINQSTGVGTVIGNCGFPDMDALSRDASGRVLGAQQGAEIPHLIQIDPNGGPGMIVALPFLNRMTGIAFAPGSTRFLYATDIVGSVSTNIYLLDLSVPFGDSNIGTFIGTEDSTRLSGITFGPDGQLYGWSVGAGLGTVNLSTGAFTDVNPAVGGLNEIQDLTFGPDGTLYGGASALYRINISTGEETLIGSGGYAGLSALAFVPAPGPVSVLMLGGGCLGLRRRRACLKVSQRRHHL
jgi:hypothetical protein